eukprot:54964-Eustigmatos_ZCMA.PRE.1
MTARNLMHVGHRTHATDCLGICCGSTRMQAIGCAHQFSQGTLEALYGFSWTVMHTPSRKESADKSIIFEVRDQLKYVRCNMCASPRPPGM